MNYRHAFHAGNFADLLKHAVLTEILASLTADPKPLTMIDTHAGAGVYDLTGEMARKTGEAASGVAVLMADDTAPPAFASLKSAIRRANSADTPRFYPGSPMLIAGTLRPRDAYIACEIRDDDYKALEAALPRNPAIEVVKADGWAMAAARTPRPPARVLVLIDPPFERADDYARIIQTVRTVLDYARIIQTVRTVLRANPAAILAIWLPIKDLATLDACLGDLEDATGRANLTVAQVRLRPLSDPMRMNGCAMAVINPTDGLRGRAKAVAEWIVASFGEAGARATIG